MDRVAVRGRPIVQLDLGDAELVLERLGALERVDALVNNAAMQLFKPLADTTVADWDEVQAVNLRGRVRLRQGVSAPARAARGSVVNIASVHARATSLVDRRLRGVQGRPGALTRAAALELGPSACASTRSCPAPS